MYTHQVNFAFWVLFGGSALGYCRAVIARFPEIYGAVFILVSFSILMIRLFRNTP